MTGRLMAAASLMAAVGDKGEDDYGYKWEVRIVEFGPDKQKAICWEPEPIRAAIPAYEGAKVFALGEGQHQDKPHRYGKSVRDLVGWIEGVSADERGLKGYLNILKSAKWLRDTVVDSWARGNKGLIGLSNDVGGETGTKVVDGKRMRVPVRIEDVTVDVVYQPAAGGQFLRMAAALEAGQKESKDMEKMLSVLKGKRPDLYASIEAKVADGSVTEDEVLEKLDVAMTAAANACSNCGAENEAGDVFCAKCGCKRNCGGAVADESTFNRTKVVASGVTLDRRLFDAALPSHSEERIRALYSGRVFADAELRASIKDEKSYLDKLTGSGRVSGSGDVRVSRAFEDKLQAGMDKLLKVNVGNKFSDIPSFGSLRAAYTALTGDAEVRGFITDPAVRRNLLASFESTTFAYVLGNSMYRRLVADYKEGMDFGANHVISTKRNAKDFRPLQTVRVSYFGDLPDVTPETVDYPDLGVLSDEKVDYTLKQKGGTITITRQMIINDDMGLVEKILKRLPRTARRTLAKKVWSKLLSNAAYKGDNKAIFHADHGNLGSAAYSVNALVAGNLALMNMAEPGSSEKLMLSMKAVSIPTALWDTARKINRTAGEPGTANHGNPVYQSFGANDERIFTNPFQTDVNDWLLIADPNEVEIVEVAFLNGQEEPELFVADNPIVGQSFVADKIQYKIRHEYEAEVVDYRGVYKAVVA